MKTLICIPCMDQVPTAFMQSLLSMRMVGEVRFSISCSSLIYDARNKLAEQAIDGGYDRCLWFDSDMVFPPDTMERLSEHLNNGKEIISGLYFTRKNPVIPVIYDNCGYFTQEDGKLRPTAHSFYDYPRNSVVEVEGLGFGCVMMTVDLLKRVRDKYGLPFAPVLGFGEDLSFCGRAIEMGTKIYCDTSLVCGHIAQSLVNEDTYLSLGGATKYVVAGKSQAGDPGQN